MSDNSAIEWTDATWNPIRGCSRVSEGCRNCYAERTAARFSGPGMPYEGLARISPTPRWTGEVRFVEEHLSDPVRWKRPRRIFVNSMSDLFHERLPVEMIDRIFGVMAWCGRHTFQVLTKRPGRMLEYVTEMAMMSGRQRANRIASAGLMARGLKGSPSAACGELGWPLSNVWLGISAEDQDAADRRVPLLIRTPAARRFVSAEPLLGPIDFSKWINLCRGDLVLRDGAYDERAHEAANQRGGFIRPDAWALHWIIVGGESGPGARPMDPAWARSIRDLCDRAGVAFFFKQWGGPRPKSGGRELDGRTWNQMPKWIGA